MDPLTFAASKYHMNPTDKSHYQARRQKGKLPYGSSVVNSMCRLRSQGHVKHTAAIGQAAIVVDGNCVLQLLMSIVPSLPETAS